MTSTLNVSIFITQVGYIIMILAVLCLKIRMTNDKNGALSNLQKLGSI